MSALPRVPAGMVASATRAPGHRVWLMPSWDPGRCHQIRVAREGFGHVSGSTAEVGLGHWKRSGPSPVGPLTDLQALLGKRMKRFGKHFYNKRQSVGKGFYCTSRGVTRRLEGSRTRWTPGLRAARSEIPALRTRVRAHHSHERTLSGGAATPGSSSAPPDKHGLLSCQPTAVAICLISVN